MKYLKRFSETLDESSSNESIEEQIYNQVLNSIKDCFQEFEDNGWHWISDVSYPGISIWQNPNFNCRMMHKEESDPRNWTLNENPYEKNIDITGDIKSDGSIDWEMNEDETDSEDGKDFLVAVKRLHDDTGLDFSFSYNNRGGERRIIIQGRI
jgi:hypothetical protein